MNRPELTLFSNDAHSAGFRLDRLEVYNWGTFHEKVCKLYLSGENALLTGANGAGKTTLVDVIIALLNPTPERYFNQSAGVADTKRTRRVEDYVRGVYGQSAKGREQLRDRPDQPPTYTVILGVFYNNDLKQHYTLAHLYWFKEGSLQKRFYTAPIALNIEEHFRFSGDIRTFNSYLSKSLQVRPYDSFSDYALDFQPKLGMRRPEKATQATGRTKPLHLFAKTAGIKVLGNLDAFIRENMLDEAGMNEQFDQLKKEYADIAETQQTLDKLARQEQMLIPLSAKNIQRAAQSDTSQKLARIQSVISPWFAREQVGLLEAAIKRTNNELEKNAHDLELADQQLDAWRKDLSAIERQIENNDTGRRLKTLQDDKQRADNLLLSQRKEAQKYAQIAQSLGFLPEPDGGLFYAQRGQLEQTAQTLLDEKTAQTNLRDELVGEKRDKNREISRLETEISSLRKRQNNLPANLTECRSRLAQAIGAAESELPFVGELVQVKEHERIEWEYALEKLLTPFSLHLLVPARRLKAAIQWVRANQLGILLRFTEADDAAGEALSNDRNTALAANKLEVRQQSPFANWLTNELNKRYPHYCTTDNAEYERRSKALTPEGLYKNDKQHQKDDRNKKIDFVLGWDNAEKIKKLSQELSAIQRDIRQLEERLVPIDTKIRQFDAQLADVKRLGDFTDFKTIDIKGTQSTLQALIVQIDALTRDSVEIKTLEQQQKKVLATIQQAEKNRDTLIKEEYRASTKLEQFVALHTLKSNDAAQLDDNSTAVSILLEHLQPLPELDIDNIEKIADEYNRDLRRKIGEAKEQQNLLQREMEQILREFKLPAKSIREQFPTWDNDTDSLGGPVIEHVYDYLSLLERIQRDQLPVLRERYQTRAGEDIGNAMQAFRRQLDDQLSDHLDNIDSINRSLRALPYSQDTYLQIVTDEVWKKGRIGEFTALLSSWDYDRAVFHTAAESEKLAIRRETVQKIGAIIKRLEDNEPWRKEVTDVRNWLNFRTQQYYQTDSTPVSGTLLDSTGGKSGGEQAKLTYTILAAALTYQFNISADERNARSFRFIVVDEAFSKLDADFSTYLLDLLSKLKFQMLIITPNTGVKIGEKYMSHLIFVQKVSEVPPRSVAHIYSIKELKTQPVQ